VICPATEANLGDGVFDLPGYAAVKGRWSIGSDSHVTRRWSEELRLLEYSQRLTHRKRNMAAQVMGHSGSAPAMLEAALAAGPVASGQPTGGIALGQRADFCVLDAQSPALLGIPADHMLDALVFSSPDARFDAAYVAGQAAHAKSDARFAQTMHALWGG
jgi:formimidoylglutamate deiminase